MKKCIVHCLLTLVMAGVLCSNSFAQQEQSSLKKTEYLYQWVEKLTDLMVVDGFNPPLASRCYAYPTVAAYEAVVPSSDEYRSMEGQLNGLENVPRPMAGKSYDYRLAAITAFALVGKKMVYREDDVEMLLEKHYNKIKEEEHVDEEVFERSIAFGQAIAEHILKWASKDNYKETRSMPRYALSEAPGAYELTPPDYRPALEPHWNKLRPFVLDSASQYTHYAPVPFSTDTNSAFYKQAMVVYHAAKNPTEEELIIARFWDCNPDITLHTGHLMLNRRQMSPGAHWINICSQACKQENFNIMQAAEAYMLTSICMADGFISCWDQKYESNLIRPVTYINRYIDPEWQPPLVTPPFPEHTSGHSCISRTSALALTSVFGENYYFEDHTEVGYGLPVRSFSSFLEASDEAAMSRKLGGIHYDAANEMGLKQGAEVANFILSNVSTRTTR